VRQPEYFAISLVFRKTSHRSPWVRIIAFTAQLPDLHSNLLMDLDFVISSPLVQVTMPHIWFLFVSSQFCSALPSDITSR